MTDAQNEARAIAFAAAGQVSDNHDAGCVETLVGTLVATALAAKDAEIERLTDQNAALGSDAAAARKAAAINLARAERAESQLAEANKALEPFARAADRVRATSGDARLLVVFTDGAQLTVGHLRAARRARETQGGE